VRDAWRNSCPFEGKFAAPSDRQINTAENRRAGLYKVSWNFEPITRCNNNSIPPNLFLTLTLTSRIEKTRIDIHSIDVSRSHRVRSLSNQRFTIALPCGASPRGIPCPKRSCCSRRVRVASLHHDLPIHLR